MENKPENIATELINSRLSSLNTSVGEDTEKRECLCTLGGDVNWCSHPGKQYGSSSKS